MSSSMGGQAARQRPRLGLVYLGPRPGLRGAPGPPGSPPLTLSPQLPKPERARLCRARRLPSPHGPNSCGIPIRALRGSPESTPNRLRILLPLTAPIGSPSPLGFLPHPGEPRPPPGLPRGSPIPHPSLRPPKIALGAAGPPMVPHTDPLTAGRALPGTRQNFNPAPPPPAHARPPRRECAPRAIVSPGSRGRRPAPSWLREGELWLLGLGPREGAATMRG